MTVPRRGQPWTDAEIEIVLDVYFEMLVNELGGHEYVKAEYRRRCAERLRSRSDKAIEFKWCNISAVLEEMSQPWISGYKPLANYQRKLRVCVEARLGRNPDSRVEPG